MKKITDENLSDAIADLAHAVGTRFDKVDARFDKVDARFEQVEFKLDETREVLAKAIKEISNSISLPRCPIPVKKLTASRAGWSP